MNRVIYKQIDFSFLTGLCLVHDANDFVIQKMIFVQFLFGCLIRVCIHIFGTGRNNNDFMSFFMQFIDIISRIFLKRSIRDNFIVILFAKLQFFLFPFVRKCIVRYVILLQLLFTDMKIFCYKRNKIRKRLR